MKKFTQLQLLLAGILLMGVYSCAPKYTASFKPSSNFYQPEVQTADKSEVAVNTEEVIEATDEPVVIAPQTEESLAKVQEVKSSEAVVSTEKVMPQVKAPSIEKLVKKYESRVEEIENSGLDHKEIKREIRTEKKAARKEIKRELKKDIKELRDNNASDQYVLMMILAVILPPLAVGLTYGIVDKFWISLLLTLLFFIPGIIYALIVVNDYYR